MLLISKIGIKKFKTKEQGLPTIPEEPKNDSDECISVDSNSKHN